MSGFGGFGNTDEFLVIMGLLSAGQASLPCSGCMGWPLRRSPHQEENGHAARALGCPQLRAVHRHRSTHLMSTVPVTPMRFLFQLNSMGVRVLGVLNVPLLTESVGMRVRCRHELESGSWRRHFLGCSCPVAAPPICCPGADSDRGHSDHDLSDAGLFRKRHIPWTFRSTLRMVSGGLLATLGVVLACTGVPAAFAARAAAPLWARNSLRFFILTLPFWIVILLGIVELLFQMTGAGFLDSALNPFIAIGDNFRSLRKPEAVLFWLALAGLVPCRCSCMPPVNAPRLRPFVALLPNPTPMLPSPEEEPEA